VVNRKPESSELPDAVRAFLEGDVTLMPGALKPAEGDALVAALVARGDSLRLARLGESKDKALAKSARRALHLLRTRGAKIEEVKHEYRVAGPYAEEAEAAAALSMASMIDGRGERVVWLSQLTASYDGGGLHVYQAELSESRGLIGFEVGAVKRRDWRMHVEEATHNPRAIVAQLPSAHVRRLLEQAYERTVAAGRVPPESFARTRLELAPVEPLAGPHPVYALALPLPADEAVARLAILHARPELRTWVAPKESLDAFDLEVGEIVTSRLVVDPAQRRLQLRGVVERAADRLLTSAYRALLTERFLETAYVIALRGELDFARLVVSAAERVRDETIAAAAQPFVLGMFEKLLDLDRLGAKDSGEPPEPAPSGPGGLILP
jgi:hypothetical protein